jgi:hypothetical protein
MTASFCRIGDSLPLPYLFWVCSLRLNKFIDCMYMSFDIAWMIFTTSIAVVFLGIVFALTGLEDERRKAMTAI